MRGLATKVLAVVFVWAALVGCEGADSSRSGGGGDGDTDGDSDADADGDADGDTDTGTGCEEVAFPVAGHPPDILILLDRSNSMTSGSPTYWSTVTAAIETITAAMDPQINFGLMAFPYGSTECAAPPSLPYVQISEDDNADTIGTVLGGLGPDGAGTPTAAALQVAAAYLSGLADDAHRYILLATDGGPNCSGDAALQCGTCTTTQPDGATCNAHNDCLDEEQAVAIAEQINVEQGISIYVVGVGGLLGGPFLDVMTAIAAAGGTEDFYAAETPADLAAALDEIAAAAVECEFTVDWDSLGEGVSTDPNLVNVFAEGEVMPYDEDCSSGFGWRWIDDDTIALCDDLCEQYKNGDITEITASFGCVTVVE
jgi:hypothetical protein